MLILQLRCLYADLVKQTFTYKNKEEIIKKERKKERKRERDKRLQR